MSVYGAERQRPLGGVSELCLGIPNLGSDFGTGIWRGDDKVWGGHGVQEEIRLSLRGGWKSRVKAGEVEPRTVLRVRVARVGLCGCKTGQREVRVGLE